MRETILDSVWNQLHHPSLALQSRPRPRLQPCRHRLRRSMCASASPCWVCRRCVHVNSCNTARARRSSSRSRSNWHIRHCRLFRKCRERPQRLVQASRRKNVCGLGPRFSARQPLSWPRRQQLQGHGPLRLRGSESRVQSQSRRLLCLFPCLAGQPWRARLPQLLASRTSSRMRPSRDADVDLAERISSFFFV